MARNPFFTMINIIGLGTGFAAFFALWGHATRELRADQYHKDFERIGRIVTNWNWTDDGGKTWGHLTFGFCKGSVGPNTQNDFPEVESTCRILPQTSFFAEVVGHNDKILISVRDPFGQRKVFKETGALYADSNLFTFFTLPLVYGKPADVLNEAGDVVLSKTIAEKYFGNEDPRGQILLINDTVTLKVSGVFADLPSATHLKFDLVISNKNHLDAWRKAQFGWVPTYVKFHSPDIKDFEAKLNAKESQYYADEHRALPHMTLSLFVQPLKDIAYSENFLAEYFYPKSKSFLMFLGFIALSILAMAWVNYINLSITRMSNRFKEIATRKVSGATSGDMIRQFVTESICVHVLAIILALTIIQALYGPAKTTLDLDIRVSSLNDLAIPGALAVIGIFISGFYPAIISSAYKPRLLYAKSTMASQNRLIPNMLTVAQFAAAIVFILLTFGMTHQINHILNMDLGLKMDRVILIDVPAFKAKTHTVRISSLKKEIQKIRGVTGVTTSAFNVNQANGGALLARRRGADISFGMDANVVDEDFVSFYELKILSGRSIKPVEEGDVVVISRRATERLGFTSPEDALGAVIDVSVFNEWRDMEVVGVIDDYRIYNFLNMSETSTESNDDGRGIVFLNQSNSLAKKHLSTEVVSVTIDPEQFSTALTQIESSFNQLFAESLFDWSFADARIGEVYNREKIARNQVILFTCLAILIACLGLVGMISNKVTDKTREIGIRKVLGAELYQIAQILLNTSVRQLLVATAIGIPLGYYLTQQYLEKYSEKVQIQIWHYAVPILILALIMFATVSTVIWNAARRNPVDALKAE